MVEEDDVQDVYRMMVGLLGSGATVEEAQNKLGRFFDSELVAAAVGRYREIADGIFRAPDPKSFRDTDRLEPWYTGPGALDVHWPRFRSVLEADGFGHEALQSLDIASSKIVSHLPNWALSEFNGRGLVLGYVQSGKTSNFTAVMAKAVDAGYRFVIVLSGIHNNLRRQTQTRLDEQLVGPNPTRWFKLTDDSRDFGNPGNADAVLSQDRLKLLAVVKKNKSRLERLNAWLESASEHSRLSCPILVIDDEADQASINTKDAEDRTVINRLMLRLLRQPRIAYVGYTATPFANIFVDPTFEEDLYPRDFIVDLPRPDTYFGPERIFGRDALTAQEGEEGVDGLDMVRVIRDDDVALLRPPRRKVDRLTWEPTVVGVLSEAIQYFLLATAARWTRGHGSKHSSMLVHTTQYVLIHQRYQAPIDGVVAGVEASLRTGDLESLRALWERETSAVPAETVGEETVSFDDLIDHLGEVCKRCRTIIDNGSSDERLDYGRAELDTQGNLTGRIEPQVVIAIGGDTLSRGLTLEGLVVSFFLRTSSAYDTLLQMGRWFGFRPGYGDLPRVWMTDELRSYFQFLATVEAEIRIDVERYELEDLRPDEFAVRVRTHPKLAITSAMKMQSAVDCSVSYSDRRLQTILFHHDDVPWLETNQVATDRLIDALGGFGAAEHSTGGRYLWRGADQGVALDFLGTYRFHEDSFDLRSDLITEYIRAQNDQGDLLSWNVGVVERSDQTWGTIDLGTEDAVTVGLINRAAVSTLRGRANIKSLMSKPDRVMDLDLSADQLAEDDAHLQALRPRGVGLILLYPINKDSTPQRNQEGGKRRRTDLGAVRHVMGVGLVFPKALHGFTAVNYKSVALPAGLVDEPDGLTEEQMDTEDGYVGTAP